MGRWLLVFMFAMTALPAKAQVFSRAGGWEIFEAAEGCAMGMTYEGPGETELLVGISIKNGVFISIRNSNWSDVSGTEITDLVIETDGFTYVGESAVGSGHGFAIKFKDDFLDEVAKATYLHVKKAGVIIERLSLKGSAAAVTQLRRCDASVRTKAALEAREKARFADLPTNPFASSKGVAPRGSPSSWVTNDDYPAAAIRANQEGTVEFTLSVDASGRSTACAVTKSSGWPLLDQTTCSLIQRRARFTPAMNKEGEAIPSEFSSRFTWLIPK